MRKALAAVVVGVAAGGLAYPAATSVTVEARQPRSTVVSWEADGDETSFTVERARYYRGSYRQPPWEVVATLFGPVRGFEDATAEPGRSYSYRVTSTDASGATSVSVGALVETPPTLGLRVRRGEIREGWSGSVTLRGSLRFLRRAATPEFDPATQPFELKIGTAAWLTIPAGDPRWIRRHGANVWSGDDETHAELLVLDFVRNRIEYTRTAEFQQPAESSGVSPVHIVLRIGGEGVEQYLFLRDPLHDRERVLVFGSRR